MFAFTNHIRKEVWDFRNSELKDHQKAQGITKKMLCCKYTNKDRSIVVDNISSHNYRTNHKYVFLNQVTQIINDHIKLDNV